MLRAELSPCEILLLNPSPQSSEYDLISKQSHCIGLVKMSSSWSTVAPNPTWPVSGKTGHRGKCALRETPREPEGSD